MKAFFILLSLVALALSAVLILSACTPFLLTQPGVSAKAAPKVVLAAPYRVLENRQDSGFLSLTVLAPAETSPQEDISTVQAAVAVAGEPVRVTFCEAAPDGSSYSGLALCPATLWFNVANRVD